MQQLSPLVGDWTCGSGTPVWEWLWSIIAHFTPSDLHAQDTIKHLWDSGGKWCPHADVRGAKKHCEKFTFIHCGPHPIVLHVLLDSHSNLGCAWCVYFIAISHRGEVALRIDHCRSCKIHSTLFSTPKVTTDQGLWVHSPPLWLRHPSAMTQVINENAPLCPPSWWMERVSQEAAHSCDSSLAALGGLARWTGPTPYNCGRTQLSPSFYIRSLMSLASSTHFIPVPRSRVSGES